MIGAERGSLSLEHQTYRNGCGPGLWGTRLGELAVSRKREGSWYFPSFLEPRRPCEQAVVACLVGACVNGVWPGRVDRLVQLGIHGVSKARVLALRGGLDRRVGAFRRWPAGGRVPRSCGSTPSTRRSGIEGMPPAKGSGCRLRRARDGAPGSWVGIDLGETEAEAFRLEFPRGLRSPGLHGVRLCASDHQQGPNRATGTDPLLPAAALHRPLRPQQTRPLPTYPARPRLRQPAGDVQRHRPTSGEGKARRNARTLPRSTTQDRLAPPRNRGQPPGLPPVPPQRAGPNHGAPTRHSESTAKPAAEPTPPASPPTTAPALRPAAASRTEHNDQ